MINYVTKRDGSVAHFDASRIQNAIFGAMQSTGSNDEAVARNVTRKVVSMLEKEYADRRPCVEEVQDVVEKALMESRHVEIARSYILYRAKHSEMRENLKKELLEKISRREATITFEDGSEEPFEEERMLKDVQHFAEGLNKIDIPSLVNVAISNLYNGITVKELERALINAARSKIEQSPDYSLLAARFLLKTLYKRNLSHTPQTDKEAFKRNYRRNFSYYVKKGVGYNLIDERLLEFDLEKLGNAVMPFRDYQFNYRGIQTLHDRYLLKTADVEQTVFELPQYMWMRVAMGLAINEKAEVKNDRAIEFYRVMSEMLYVPSTPTLFNSGTTHPQLSSCFLNTVPDSLKGIFKTYSDNAMLSKYAGGLGTDWTNVRSLGSRIVGTNGNSQGIIPFLKIFNDIAIAVNQGGKRKGAMCAYLEIWHGDVEEFLESRKNTGDDRRRLHDVHTAVWISDLFMKRVANNRKWTLFSPTDVPDLHGSYGMDFEKKYAEYEALNLHSAKRVDAVSLWRKLLTMLFETGHPWITFKDPCNVRNPQSHCGVIHNSNLCTEITLNNSEEETAVCNLGSVNLAKFIENRTLNEALLAKTVRTAIRMLDNVIDVNYYPTVETRRSNLRHRPVGLGMMGYQDALYRMGIPFASEEHLDFCDRLTEVFSYHSIEASCDLAKEKGCYESFAGSKWSQGVFPHDTLEILEAERGVPLELDRGMSKAKEWKALKEKVKRHGMRNSNCMAIAPTATISNIVDVNPCIEPTFRNIYTKENTDGSFIVVNRYMVEDLEKLGLWDRKMINKIKYHNGSLGEIAEIPQALRDKYREVFEIPSEWLVKAAARRGKWIDQSQSLNIFLAVPSGKLLDNIYTVAWKAGLKTTYYLRTLGTSQVRKTVSIEEEPEAKPAPSLLAKNEGQPYDANECEVCQ